MKKPVIAALAVLLLTTAVITIKHQYRTQKETTELNETEENEESEENEEEDGAEKQLLSWFQSKGYPNPENLNLKYEAAWQQYLAIKKNAIQLHILN